MVLTVVSLLAVLTVLQLHKTPQGVCYFSRRGREHGELTNYNVFDAVLHTQVWGGGMGAGVVVMSGPRGRAWELQRSQHRRITSVTVSTHFICSLRLSFLCQYCCTTRRCLPHASCWTAS